MMYNVGPDELSDWEFEEMDAKGFKFVVYWYENGGYDGSGEAVGLCMEDNLIYVKNLSHCSCYGPMDGGMKAGDSMSVEEFLSHKEEVLAYDARKEIKDKVRELVS